MIMAKILGVGIATLDIINIVEGYPEEDAEIRALSQSISRGGNTTNTLVMLSQLGHQAYWHGTIADDTAASQILNDLSAYSVNTEQAICIANSTSPTSYITLNQNSGSRTIVHYRDLPELGFSTFSAINLSEFDWFHFEARNISETKKMLSHIKQTHPDIPCSVECEKNRDGIDQLYKLADVLIFSKNFCLENGFNDAKSFLNNFKAGKNQQVVVPWAVQGAYTLSAKGDINHVNTEAVKSIKDTIGAGDAFNAGLIDGLLGSKSIEKSAQLGNQLAAFKITQLGFNISDYEG